MQSNTQPRASNLPSGLLYGIVLVLVLMLLTGCGRMASLKRKTNQAIRNYRISDSRYAKTAVVLPFTNTSYISGEAFEKAFFNDFGERLEQRCAKHRLIMPDDTQFPAELTLLPRLQSGQRDNFALAHMARRRGINTIITGELVDINFFTENRGLFWYKDTHYFVRIFANLAALDTDTGSKLFDHSFERTLEVDETDYEMIQQKKSEGLVEMMNTLRALASEMAEEGCQGLRTQPWRSYIVGVDGRQVVIAAGRRAGLKVGDTLDVYDSGKPIAGIEGQQFFLPGRRIGQVKIVTLSDDSAEAHIVSGDNIEIGSALRP